MQDTEITSKAQDIENSLAMILDEHKQLFKHLEFDQIPPIVDAFNKAKSIFLLGAGRSGFMIKAAAMRLMHLGYHVYVVGETTTPAIGEGDLLLAASGSGTTGNIVKAAETAIKSGAKVTCFTTNIESPLAKLSHFVMHIPAAGKQELNETVSKQYAGSLFEQAFLLVFDAVVQHIWQNSGVNRDELWKRHANME